MIPRSETMPAILAPSAETTRAPTFPSRMRCRASETVASGVMVHTSRPLLARMCSTFTGRSSPLHRARPEARVPQAPPVDRVRQDRSGLPPLELGQLTFRPDRVGQRPHPAIPVARLDARGLEDPVASGYRPAEPVGILVGDGEGDDVQPEPLQAPQLAVGGAAAVILDLDLVRPCHRRTSLAGTNASRSPIDEAGSADRASRSSLPGAKHTTILSVGQGGLSGSRVKCGLSRQLVGEQRLSLYNLCAIVRISAKIRTVWPARASRPW